MVRGLRRAASLLLTGAASAGLLLLPFHLPLHHAPAHVVLSVIIPFFPTTTTHQPGSGRPTTQGRSDEE